MLGQQTVAHGPTVHGKYPRELNYNYRQGVASNVVKHSKVRNLGLRVLENKPKMAYYCDLSKMGKKRQQKTGAGDLQRLPEIACKG